METQASEGLEQGVVEHSMDKRQEELMQIHPEFINV